MAQVTPQVRWIKFSMNKVFNAFNFLNSSFEEPNPPVFRHFANNTQEKLKENPPVLIRNAETGQIEGLFPLITWAKKFACVSAGVGPKWIPAKNVKLYPTQECTDNSMSTEMTTQTWSPHTDYSSCLMYFAQLANTAHHEVYVTVKTSKTVGIVEIFWQKCGVSRVKKHPNKSTFAKLS